MRILAFLLFLFFGLPFLEIYLFVRVAAQIGFFPAVALTLAFMALGVLLIRYQGIITLTRVRDCLSEGRTPAMALLEGLMMLVAGVLFLLPGFFTDFLGLLLQIPPLRRVLIRFWLRHTGIKRPPSGGGPTIIEGEFTREDQERIEGRGARNEGKGKEK